MMVDAKSALLANNKSTNNKTFVDNDIFKGIIKKLLINLEVARQRTFSRNA